MCNWQQIFEDYSPCSVWTLLLGQLSDSDSTPQAAFVQIVKKEREREKRERTIEGRKRTKSFVMYSLLLEWCSYLHNNSVTPSTEAAVKYSVQATAAQKCQDITQEQGLLSKKRRSRRRTKNKTLGHLINWININCLSTACVLSFGAERKEFPTSQLSTTVGLVQALWGPDLIKVLLTDVPLIHSQNTLAFGEMQKKPCD